MVPRLLKNGLGELPQHPACLPLFGCEITFVERFSFFAVVLALELVASPKNAK